MTRRLSPAVKRSCPIECLAPLLTQPTFDALRAGLLGWRRIPAPTPLQESDMARSRILAISSLSCGVGCATLAISRLRTSR